MFNYSNKKATEYHPQIMQQSTMSSTEMINWFGNYRFLYAVLTLLFFIFYGFWLKI